MTFLMLILRPPFLYDPLGVGDSITEWINESFNPWPIVQLAVEVMNGFIEMINGIIRTNPYAFLDGSVYSAVSGMVSDGIKTIASSILVIVWVIGMLRSAARINSPFHDPMEFPFKFIRLFVAEALIMSYDYIVGFIFDLSTAAVNMIASPGSTAAFNIPDNLSDILATGNFGTELLLWVLTIAFLGNVLIAGVKLSLTVLGRFLKIYIVIFLAPIALAFFGSEKTEQNAIKYLEGVGSLALQTIVIVLSISIYMIFANSSNLTTLITNYFDFSESGIAITWFIEQFFLINLLLALVSASDQIAERYL